MNSILHNISESLFKKAWEVMNKEVTFSQYAVGVFMTASISIGGYVAHSIASLNEHMATIIAKTSYQESRLNRHDEVIESIRNYNKHCVR